MGRSKPTTKRRIGPRPQTFTVLRRDLTSCLEQMARLQKQIDRLRDEVGTLREKIRS